MLKLNLFFQVLLCLDSLKLAYSFQLISLLPPTESDAVTTSNDDENNVGSDLSIESIENPTATCPRFRDINTCPLIKYFDSPKDIISLETCNRHAKTVIAGYSDVFLDQPEAILSDTFLNHIGSTDDTIRKEPIPVFYDSKHINILEPRCLYDETQDSVIRSGSKCNYECKSPYKRGVLLNEKLKGILKKSNILNDSNSDSLSYGDYTGITPTGSLEILAETEPEIEIKCGETGEWSLDEGQPFYDSNGMETRIIGSPSQSAASSPSTTSNYFLPCPYYSLSFGYFFHIMSKTLIGEPSSYTSGGGSITLGPFLRSTTNRSEDIELHYRDIMELILVKEFSSAKGRNWKFFRENNDFQFTSPILPKISKDIRFVDCNTNSNVTDLATSTARNLKLESANYPYGISKTETVKLSTIASMGERIMLNFILIENLRD